MHEGENRKIPEIRRKKPRKILYLWHLNHSSKLGQAGKKSSEGPFGRYFTDHHLILPVTVNGHFIEFPSSSTTVRICSPASARNSV